MTRQDALWFAEILDIEGTTFTPAADKRGDWALIVLREGFPPQRFTRVESVKDAYYDALAAIGEA